MNDPVHPEALLISAVVRSKDHATLARQNVSANLFHVFDEEARWLEQYILRSGKTPSKAALRQAYPDFTIYSVDDVEHWCEEVRKSHKRQSLVDLMDEALNLVDAGDEDSALRTLATGIVSVNATSGGMNTDYDVMEQWEEIYGIVADRVDRVRATGFAGIPTGFASLDFITGGWQPSWFCVIAARLGVGKTWTAVRSAWEAARTQHSVCYFSLEQSRFQIGMRVHAFGSRQYARQAFNPMDLNKGTGFDLRDYKKFLQELRDKKGQGKFFINDSSRGQVTPASIGAIVEAKQPDIIYIDYLTLLGATSDDWRGTAKLSSDLQTIAQRYNVPIVALSQVNRLGISKEPPGAEHLSQADAIGQDADLVLTMTQRSQNVMKLKLAKFRHGPGGITWHAKFSPGTGEYDEITESEAITQIEADGEDD